MVIPHVKRFNAFDGELIQVEIDKCTYILYISVHVNPSDHLLAWLKGFQITKNTSIRQLNHQFHRRACFHAVHRSIETDMSK